MWIFCCCSEKALMNGTIFFTIQVVGHFDPFVVLAPVGFFKNDEKPSYVLCDCPEEANVLYLLS